MTMTPYQKAVELYERFYELTPVGASNLSVQNALIVVGEILYEYDEHVNPFFKSPRFRYWEKVKEEILKM